MTPVSTEELLFNALLEYAREGRPVSFVWDDGAETYIWTVGKPKGGIFQFKAAYLEDALEQLEMMDEIVRERGL